MVLRRNQSNIFASLCCIFNLVALIQDDVILKDTMKNIIIYDLKLFLHSFCSTPKLIPVQLPPLILLLLLSPEILF